MFFNFIHMHEWNTSYQICCRYVTAKCYVYIVNPPVYEVAKNTCHQEIFFFRELQGFFHIFFFTPETYSYPPIADVAQNTFEQLFSREKLH